MTRYDIAVVLASLAVGAAILVGGGEARDPTDRERPAVHRSDDIPARWPAVARVSDDTESLDAGAPIASLGSPLVDEDAKVRLKALAARAR